MTEETGVKEMKSKPNVRMALVTVGVLGAIAGSGAMLNACGVLDQTGEIMEMEEGRNGVKAEVNDGSNGDYEVYLIPATECEKGDRIDDCADTDDYLVTPDGAVPGLNRGNDRDGGDD